MVKKFGIRLIVFLLIATSFLAGCNSKGGALKDKDAQKALVDALNSNLQPIEIPDNNYIVTYYADGKDISFLKTLDRRTTDTTDTITYKVGLSGKKDVNAALHTYDTNKYEFNAFCLIPYDSDIHFRQFEKGRFVNDKNYYIRFNTPEIGKADVKLVFNKYKQGWKLDSYTITFDREDYSKRSKDTYIPPKDELDSIVKKIIKDGKISYY